jgi:hypothetical protein
VYGSLVGFLIFFSCSVFGEENSGGEIQNKRELDNPLLIVKQRPDEQLMILALYLGNRILINGFIAYKEEGKIWLPLTDIMTGFEYPIKVYANNGVAKGWFLDEDRKFSLDLSLGKAEIDGKDFYLDSSKVELHENDIFVEIEELEKWFPVQLDFDTGRHGIVVNSVEPLPIEVREEIEKNRKKAGSGFSKKDLDNAVDADGYFSGPLTDISVSHQRTKRKDDTFSDTNYSVVSYANLLDLDAMLSMNVIDEDKIWRTRLGRKSLDNNILGFAREFQMGDVFSSSSPLVAGSALGRGAYITSFEDYQLTESGNITLEGELLEGWEVELYQNGNLVDYITESQENRYFFNVPSLSGINNMKLVFYGPQGQKRKEEKTFYVDPNMAREGKFEMKASYIEEDRNVIESDDSNNNNMWDDEEIYPSRFMIEGEYGLSDLAAFNLAYFNLPDVHDDSVQKDYVSAAIKGSLLGFLSELHLARELDEKDVGYFLNFKGEVLDWNLSLTHSEFNGLESERSYYGGNFLKSKSSLRIAGYVDLLYIDRLPLSFSFNNKINANNLSEEELSARVSYNMFKYYRLSTNVKFKDDFYDNDTVAGGTQLGRRYGKWGIRGTIDYDIKPENTLNNTSVNLDYQFDSDMNAVLTFKRNFINSYYVENTDDKIDTISLGVNYKSEYGAFGGEFMASSNDTQSIGINYSVGIGYDNYENKLHLNGKGYRGSGAVSARAYLDKNQNEEYDEGEYLVKKVAFTSNKNRENKTDEEGYVFLENLTSYDVEKLKVKQDSIEEDFTWVPADADGYKIIPRPGAVSRLDFPIWETGDIEGTIYQKRDSGEVSEMKGIEVKVVDPKGEVVDKRISAFDGYYLFQRLPLKEYKLEFDNKQLQELGFSCIASKVVKLSPENKVVIVDDVILDKGKCDLDYSREFERDIAERIEGKRVVERANVEPGVTRYDPSIGKLKGLEDAPVKSEEQIEQEVAEKIKGKRIIERADAEAENESTADQFRKFIYKFMRGEYFKFD